MSISAILVPPAFRLAEPAQLRGIALPRRVLVERIEAGVGARLEQRARDERASGHMHVVDHGDVAVDHGRAADRAVPADARASGDADASGDRAVRADAHVVADLDLVVELHALLDYGVVQCPAVDSGVGADLDVVADAYAADLGDLDPAVLLARDAEAVRSDHHSGVNDDTPAERALRVDHHARIQAAVFSDDDFVADHASGAHRNAFSELRARGDHGRGMHARRLHHDGIEKLRYAREVGVGIVGDDARQLGQAFVLGGDDDGGGVRLRKPFYEFPGIEECNLSRARVLERADLADQGLRVPGDAAAEARSDLPERQRPRHAVIWRAACLPA